MSSVTLTAATRQNLLSLQDTANLLSSTQNRLSTGKKVNSALDDPTSFFTSQALSGRSGDLGSLLNGISNGVQTIQAANQGITSIQKLVDSAKSTANQALADKSGTTIGTPETAAKLSSGVAYQGSAGAAADGTHDFTSLISKFTITDGATTGNSATVTLDANSLKGVVKDITKVSVDDVITAINNQISNSTSAPNIQASKDANGAITFTSTTTGSDAKITITNDSTNTADIGFGKTASAVISAQGSDATNGPERAIAKGGAALTLPIAIDTGKDASFTIQLGTGTAKTIDLSTGSITAVSKTAVTKAELVSNINTKIAADADLKGKVVAEIGSDNILTIKTLAKGADASITVAKTTGSNVDLGFNTAVTDKGAASSTSGASNSTRATLAKQFNSLLEQITQQAKDSSYNGINLLYRSGADSKENSLKVTFNETGSSNLNIEGSKLDADGLGLNSIAGNFQSDDEINTTLTALTKATSQLRAQASTFGSNLSVVQNRQDFSKNLINILDTGAANLTNADLNEEAANSQALSTRNSIATSALSLANQAQQGILQLLR